MDVDLSGVESALDGISSSLSSIQSSLSDASTSIDFSTFEGIAILAICIVGSVVGWRKVLSGLTVFVIYDVAKNSGTPDDSGNIMGLIVIILLWCGVSTLARKIQSQFHKNSQPVLHSEEELPVTNSSVQRALAKTR